MSLKLRVKKILLNKCKSIFMSLNKITSIYINYNKVLFSLMLAFSAVFVSACSLWLDHDEHNMREQFSENFDTLVLIEVMQREDKEVSRLALDWISESASVATKNSNDRHSASISQERWNQYKTLFYAAGVEDGFMIMNHPKESRVLVMMVNSYFGFTYREEPPERVFKSFNECRAIKFDDHYRCYIFLRKNWYLNMGPINEPLPYKN